MSQQSGVLGTGRDPTHGLGPADLQNLTGRVGSDRAGGVRRFSKTHGSGRVTLNRPGPTRPDAIREV